MVEIKIENLLTIDYIYFVLISTFGACLYSRYTFSFVFTRNILSINSNIRIKKANFRRN